MPRTLPRATEAASIPTRFMKLKRPIHQLRAGVIGSGFIGPVHIEALQRLGVSSVGELATRTEAELLGVKNFGQTSLLEIKQRLEELGLGLRKLD